MSQVIVRAEFGLAARRKKTASRSSRDLISRLGGADRFSAENDQKT
jgi:hypothetical protein